MKIVDNAQDSVSGTFLQEYPVIDVAAIELNEMEVFWSCLKNLPGAVQVLAYFQKDSTSKFPSIEAASKGPTEQLDGIQFKWFRMALSNLLRIPKNLKESIQLDSCE